MCSRKLASNQMLGGGGRDNPNLCRIDKRQALSSAMSQIMKKDPLLLFAVRL